RRAALIREHRQKPLRQSGNLAHHFPTPENSAQPPNQHPSLIPKEAPQNRVPHISILRCGLYGCPIFATVLSSLRWASRKARPLPPITPRQTAASPADDAHDAPP